MTTQYDIEFIQRLEKVLGRKLDAYPNYDLDEAEIFRERVDEAGRVARKQMNEDEKSKKGKGSRKRPMSLRSGDRDGEDDLDAVGISAAFKKKPRS